MVDDKFKHLTFFFVVVAGEGGVKFLYDVNSGNVMLSSNTLTFTCSTQSGVLLIANILPFPSSPVQ